MNAFLHACVAGVNGIGRGFCTHAVGMFVQSGVLIAVFLIADLLLHSRLRATVRYWIWMLVIIKLLLPPTFALPTGIGHWLGEYAALPSPAGRQALEAAGSQESPGQPVLPETAGQPLAPLAQRSNADVEAAMTDPVESAAGPGARLTWQGAAVLLWGVGVLAFVVLVIRRVLFVRRLVAQGHPAQGEPADLLEECRRRMNIRRPVGMKLLSGSFSPAVCGLRRPTILLPEALLTRLTPDNLRAVLIHELAHVKRADLWVNSLQTVLQITYFYNPLVWLANAIVRRVREQAVDEMSLVALGAEARSYGNTLIDVAEMALGRANPALRLVGVAESKKSLEGRIRHMITRPIPKNARVGVAGVLTVVALGAVMLPMAGARTEAPAREFTARLSNGATVTLAGVCHWVAQEPVCWQPDGSRLEQDIRPARGGQGPETRAYGFMVQVTGPNAPELSWDRIGGAKSGIRECDVLDRRDKPVPGFRAVTTSLENAATETTLRLGVAAGPWKTVFTHNGHGTKAVAGPEGILWSQAIEDAEGTHIIATTPWYTDRVKRVVAVDVQGALHTDARSSIVSSGNVGQMTAAVFQGLRRDNMREFQFQVRPYEWVEFENVSLQPGVKTEPRVQTSSESPVSRRAGSDDSPTGTAPATGKARDSIPNIFILSPPRAGANVFGQVAAKAEDWTRNKTGRDHSKKSYDEIFDGTLNRTSHDILVLVFTLEAQERIPAGYEDLLPQPWSQIEEQLQQGHTVELFGRARGLTVILLAAPKAEQLRQVIAGSRFLNDPQALLGRSGKGCDIALESFKVRPGHVPGAYQAVVSGRNRGYAASPAFVVHFHTGDPAIDARTSGAGPLQPRETWDAGSAEFLLKEGVNDVSVVLDPADLIDELDETNNRAALRIVVKNGQIVEQSAVAAGARGGEPGVALRDYLVNRSVGDFPPTEDLSTPEAAYAAINRLLADGDTAGLQRVSVATLGERPARESRDPKRAVDSEWAGVLSNARILRVMIWNDTRAIVLAELPQTFSGKEIAAPIDVRSLKLVDGRWLNTGNNRFWTVKEAKAQFLARFKGSEPKE